ncbi:MAG: nucleotidyltransferase [Gammaproteobacteria bacterium]|jgi:nucleotidyltransferase substrate binding protein (TIGR01987 family)|nr:nucleotidyltransferase [Gammaproteobacteria bacterium]MBT3844368.1 nucleotidyltransferase [Gammaproteobacteria bacterium]MBT4787925.1 nucleotidyltransferase [Gammaproteobacteria bacterium]MBT6653040.1 nucleotidyltransferase [Gammaproteobacteria bacterium]HIJ25466.1 nucleotidyltransferase [Gammaproteobacteria bacterium]
MTEDIRWIQRFNNWTKALGQLTRFLDREELNELELQGLVQSFEYNHELSWKTQKDFLEAQGVTELYGSKNVAKKAFETGLVEDGEVWMDMIDSRNLTSHTYNEETTEKITTAIIEQYYDAFRELHAKLKGLAEQELNG